MKNGVTTTDELKSLYLREPKYSGTMPARWHAMLENEGCLQAISFHRRIRDLFCSRVKLQDIQSKIISQS